jgi:DNA-binding NarL/FixJ family response regulator
MLQLSGKRALVVEDDPNLGFVQARSLTRAGMITKHVRTLREALEELFPGAWELLLVNLELRDGSGLALARGAVRLVPRPAILITSVLPDPLALGELHELGVPFVPRSLLASCPVEWVLAPLAHAIKGGFAEDEGGVPSGAPTRSCAENHSVEARKKLSDREAEILALLTNGRAPKEIAFELGLSHATIRTHARNAYRKLGVTNLRETLALARGR